jgi:hypothetical protein
MRFWAEVTGIISARPTNGGHVVTPFGRQLLLGDEQAPALDPFLEDIQTLWLLHWVMATQPHPPMFAWSFLLNDWQQEISRTRVLQAFKREASIQHERELSEVTLAQHLDMFLHTYIPARGKKGEVVEDALDSPFTELELLQRSGYDEKLGQPGKAEPVYVFRRDPKLEIGDMLFAWCVFDFWKSRHQSEQTLPFGEVVAGRGSPGQIFKLPEDDIRARLESIERNSDGRLIYDDSAMTPRLRKNQKLNQIKLEEIYAATRV